LAARVWRRFAAPGGGFTALIALEAAVTALPEKLALGGEGAAL